MRSTTARPAMSPGGDAYPGGCHGPRTWRNTSCACPLSPKALSLPVTLACCLTTVTSATARVSRVSCFTLVASLEDWRSAIAYVRDLGDVHPTKVVLWGSSFSGGHVLWTSSGDSGIAVVIAQGLFSNGLASALAMSPLVVTKLTVIALYDRIGALFGEKPLIVPVAGRPGETALMTAPDAYDGYFNLVPAGTSVNNYGSARFALDIVRYYPGRKAANIQAPVLFCICNNDTVAPAKPTLRYANRAPRKEIKRYDYGHFDIYLGDAFETIIRDQLEFLSRIVPVNPDPKHEHSVPLGDRIPRRPFVRAHPC